MKGGIKQERTLKLRSLSSKKDTKRSSKKKRRHKKTAARKQKAKMQKYKQKKNAAAEAKNENTEAETEEVEGTCTGTTVHDGVETTREASERHPGPHTVNEEANHIVLHMEHVEHDMNDNTGERTKTMHNTTNANGEQTEIVIANENAEAGAEEAEGTSTEIMLNDGVEVTGGTGEEHPELSTSQVTSWVKSITRDAHIRMKRQVLSCYMSAAT